MVPKWIPILTCDKMLSDRGGLELTLSELQPNWTNSNTTHNLYDEDTDTNKQKTKTLSTSSQLQPNWTNSNTPHNLHIYSWRGHRYPIYHISYILYDKAGAEISSLIAINKQKPHWRYFKSASTKLDPFHHVQIGELGMTLSKAPNWPNFIALCPSQRPTNYIVPKQIALVLECKLNWTGPLYTSNWIATLIPKHEILFSALLLFWCGSISKTYSGRGTLITQSVSDSHTAVSGGIIYHVKY